MKYQLRSVQVDTIADVSVTYHPILEAQVDTFSLKQLIRCQTSYDVLIDWVEKNVWVKRVDSSLHV